MSKEIEIKKREAKEDENKEADIRETECYEKNGSKEEEKG